MRYLPFNRPVPSTYCLVEDPSAEFGLRIKVNCPKLIESTPLYQRNPHRGDAFFVKKRGEKLVTVCSDTSTIVIMKIRFTLTNDQRTEQRL